MNTNTKIIIAVLAGCLVGSGATMAISGHHSHDMHHGDMANESGIQMHDTMARMNTVLDGKTGDAFDQAFLAEMIMHHEGAIEMAQSALTNAKHQEIKDLAQEIIDAQNSEIVEMRAWQSEWYSSTTPSTNR